MGRRGSGLPLPLPVTCLVLAWAAGAGGAEVPHQPVCFSDYISFSTCEWRMAGPADCSAELRLTYRLNFPISENRTCVPENTASAVCLCTLLMDDVVSGDTYQLDLWAGAQLLWSDSFTPSEHVKPRAPGNLTVHADAPDKWQLNWSSPYPSENFLYPHLSYQVLIWNEDDPTEVTVHDVTYQELTLRISASTLRPGASYRARVRARARAYGGSWSEWGPSARWLNYYAWPWERHLPLAVIISCMVILVICLSCYFSIIKIKKEWWDRIPTPARSPLVAVVIQDSQASLWGKKPGAQEPPKRPRWKTCLAKLLPCVLEHGTGKDAGSAKAARAGPAQGPGKSARHPPWVSEQVLWPESVSVVKHVELLENPGESKAEEDAEEEDGKGSFCPSPESSGGGCQEGRAGIAARLTESLLLDLLGGGDAGDVGESGPLPPSRSERARVPGAEVPGKAAQEASSLGGKRPLSPESAPPAPLTPSPAWGPAVVTDNPAYRSFSAFLSQSPGPGAPGPDPEPAEPLGEADPGTLSAPQPCKPRSALRPTEPETWEQILRRSVLQHGAASAPRSAPGAADGYRAFAQAVEQGSARGGGVAGSGPAGEAGYKAFSSLFAGSALHPGTCGVEASHGHGCCGASQSLPPDCPPAPLFTFGLDAEPPHSPRTPLLPGSAPECPGLEPAAKGEDPQKPPPSLAQATDALGDDLGSGIVYSALTCHLCGHLKQRHGQEERGRAAVAAGPCCGCCCGDRAEPEGSPLPGGVPLQAGRPPASPAPVGVSEEGKSALFFRPGPSHAQSSGQSPQVVAALSAGPACLSAS